MVSQTPSNPIPLPDESTGLAGFIELLQAIDDTGPLALLNETSIGDNSGGRIEL